MRRLVGGLAAVCLVAGLYGGVTAEVSAPSEATVVGTVTAAEHEVAEGYFTMGEEATVVARPGSDLHRWLAAHRGQTVRLVVTQTRDGDNDPSRRPGTGRDSAAGANEAAVH